MSILRIKSDEAIRERYALEPNPWADYPQSFACQLTEARNAWRQLLVTLLVAYVLPALRRLSFVD